MGAYQAPDGVCHRSAAQPENQRDRSRALGRAAARLVAAADLRQPEPAPEQEGRVAQVDSAALPRRHAGGTISFLGASFDVGVAPGARHTYRVQARGWSDTWSEAPYTVKFFRYPRCSISFLRIMRQRE